MQSLLEKHSGQSPITPQTHDNSPKYNNSPPNFFITLHQIINPQVQPLLFTNTSNTIQQQNTPQHFPLKPASNNSNHHPTYNRKQKSLSKLTKKFIQKFQSSNLSILILDQITNQLNVQRRRIYDIINIMESLTVVEKIKKNVYQWKGLKQAIKIIDIYSKGQPLSNSNSIHPHKPKPKKQKSLQSLSTQFLKYFSKNKQILTLQQLSNYIINQSNHNIKKTKIRRLYDIVNIFKCLGLIKKIKLAGNKPSYQWLGCKNLVKMTENYSANQHLLSDSNPEPQEDPIDEHLSQIQTKISNPPNKKLCSPSPCDNYQQQSNQSKQKQNLHNNHQQLLIRTPNSQKQQNQQSTKLTKIFSSKTTIDKQQLHPMQNFVHTNKSKYSSHKNKLHSQLYSKRTTTSPEALQQCKYNSQYPHKPSPKNVLLPSPPSNTHQSYFYSLIHKYQQSGMTSLDQIINKFNQHLWSTSNQPPPITKQRLSNRNQSQQK